MTNGELKQWLRDNSSGIYRPAREAADRIDQLETTLRLCVDEMRHSAVTGQPIGDHRVEFQMAEEALK